ncbi:MAG: hypothetical protein KDE33_29760, partial [Bacteroidetes bacterium]|nr:hypothetical protein [Bacteroidota bacterium]
SARRAVEMAAEALCGDIENISKRYEAFLQQIFPHEYDGPRRDMISFFMRGLGKIRNPSAHGTIRFQIHQEDAEIALTVVSSIFRYISEALSEENTFPNQ